MIVREVTLPLRLASLTNQRGHWAKKARAAKEHRWMASYALSNTVRGPLGVRVDGASYGVALTRVAPRALDDDNLRAACKSVRDGVADWLGIDDRDPRIRWEYAQERGKPKEYAVRIRIELLAAASNAAHSAER